MTKKAMIQKFIREEDDGSTTKTYATQLNGKLVTHNNKGAALVNKDRKLKEYYLYGVKITKEEWEKKSKLS